MLQSLSIRHVEETRSLADLLEISVTEGLLDNDVDQVLAHGVVLIVKLAVE